MFNENKVSKVPKEFMLLGHRYTVVIEPDLLEKEHAYGMADDDHKLIRLQAVGNAVKHFEDNGVKHTEPVYVTEETQIETFFHELVHIMLDATANFELSENEKFVNIMGKAFLEVYLSSVYEKDSP